MSALLPVSLAVLTDDPLVGFAQAVEEAGRVLDGLRLGVAREFDNRTDETLGEDSLARKLGAKRPWGALETVTRTSAKDARERVAEARRLAKFAVLEAAVEAGVLGRAQAVAIMEPLLPAADRADTALVEAACENLVDLSKVLPATAVVEAAEAWALVLDPDGVEPVEKAAVEKRFFRLGRAKDGLVKFSGALPVEQAAAVRALLDAYVNPRAGASVMFTPNAADDSNDVEDGRQKPMLTATETEPPTDTRTPDQKRADVMHAVFAAAARAPETPTMGGSHPTVLVVVPKDDFETGHGAARIDGEDEPVSAKTAKRIAETGGYQEVQIDSAGKILNLGDTKRCATVWQRKALAVRDKGCIIPGCTMPARWCEVHHIRPDRDGGPTDILNLTLLCWFHHNDIDTGPYQLRMGDDRTPEIRWTFGSHATEWIKAIHTPKRDLSTAT
ncbi:HNH endonuclease signature motif containing protein [Gryllotalpicola daejeonensis]|uniref:HNH endonuclease signature motif containing protein n=1 Tax=Gryllotalpicola daejeonensis TaxID=993087 RepID=UPI0031D483A9